MDCVQLLIEAGFSRRKAAEHAAALDSALKKQKDKDIQEIDNKYISKDIKEKHKK